MTDTQNGEQPQDQPVEPQEAEPQLVAVPVEDPPVQLVEQVPAQTRPAPSAADYADGEKWTPAVLIDELVRVRTERDHLQRMVDRLACWVMDTVPEEITPERGEVDVASIAIRLLTAWVCNPNGRLEGPVREALDRLDRLPGVDADEIRAQVEVARNHLANALTAEPRPRSGQGPAPTLESDDITIVRYDRDRFRVELDLAYKTIAEMFAAATGHRNGPARGVVEDLADVRARQLAAEQALTFALAGRGDAGYPVPEKGTPAYDTWAAMILDVVTTMASTKFKLDPVGGALMPVAGKAP